jgi:hypothetical protein
MAKVKTNPLHLTRKEVCSCYVPRETPPIHAVEKQGFSPKAPGLAPIPPPPQLPSCVTQNHHVSIVFSHENAKKRAISINFCESDSTEN